ncbi:unnamed protein product [Rotaria sp. Silwood2]|nr:unnamed protein product [Rotaria sp. Silwood2]
MTQKMFYMAPILNVPRSIREDDTNRYYEQEHVKHKEKQNEEEDDDLIFGALDDESSSKEKLDEISPSTDEGIHLPADGERTKKRERAPSSISTADDEWEHMLSITDGDGPFNFVNHLQSISEKRTNELTVGMSNFRAKHRLRHRSKASTLVRWRDAVKRVVQLKDPWQDFKIDRYPEEIVTRHEFDPIKRTWHESQITVKIESKPFAHGSMRECFRLKKLSVFSTHQDWDHSSNYIAKRYTDNVPVERYFDDVMMQMTTKLWATHYNQHNPPKKVDIVQMSVLEFKDRAGRPYYHLERFIDGNYIKYNSNSGFVCDDTLRHTPQAFSHFTFEASCHEQIVVDIQGVGDLYTDPQIHTSLGFEYGEGNLGIRGMALFFSTHECNPICARLNLTSFDLSPGERDRHIQQHASSPSYASNLPAQTACRGSEEPLNGLSKFGSLFRRLRSQSSISEDESDGYIHLEMCKYYQVGRFSELGSEDFDEESALYHLELAAELCVKEAIFTLAKIYLDLPRDLLSHYRLTDQAHRVTKGLNLMIRASELHETEANLYIAQFFDHGIEGSLEKDWKQAAEYYEKYIRIRENESNNLDEDSGTNEPDQIHSTDNGIPFHDHHETVARLATLYKTGGHNLVCNYQKAGDLFNKAAEMATAAMKGRLANKYYMSAEEAYALEPDDEEGEGN